MNKYCYDTNILLSKLHLLSIKGEKIIPVIVLHELDSIKAKSPDQALKYAARQAVRKIKEMKNEITFDFDFSKQHVLLNNAGNNNDDIIIECAKKHGSVIVSDDFLVQLKAEAIGIEVYESDGKFEEDNYCGYKEVLLNDEERAYLYEHLNENIYDLLVNEYLVVKSEYGEDIDCLKWNGTFHGELTEKNLSTVALGKFKPLDLYQKAAIDSLLTNSVIMLRGKAGSGKSLLALNYALHQLEKGKISKIICFCNPITVRNSSPIGFYKGTKDEKLLQSSIGNLLTSKLGGVDQVEAMIKLNKLVLLPFSDIRGYENGDSTIVWISESQNLDISLMKLALQRISDGSQIIVEGDDKAQVDSDAFAGFNNGMKRASNIFRGEKIYGEVTFNKIYRSKIAEIADRM